MIISLATRLPPHRGQSLIGRLHRQLTALWSLAIGVLHFSRATLRAKTISSVLITRQLPYPSLQSGANMPFSMDGQHETGWLGGDLLSTDAHVGSQLFRLIVRAWHVFLAEEGISMPKPLGSSQRRRSFGASCLRLCSRSPYFCFDWYI